MDLSFLQERASAVEYTVCGRSFKFYAATVQGAYMLKDLGRPVLQALGSIFSGLGQETGLTERTLSKGDGDVATSTEVTPIAPELAKLRIESRDKSIAMLVDTLLEKKNGLVMAEVIADSLQDEFPRTKGNLDRKAVAEFWEAMTVQAAVGFLTGVAIANKPVFDPLVQRLRGQRPGPDSSPSPTGPAPVQADLSAPSPSL